jgi:hypothetical protein
MSETKEQVTEERDMLRAEVDRLNTENGRLRAATAVPTAAAGAVQHQFFLTEGARQELELNGNAVINGRMMTIDQVRAELSPEQSQIQIDGPPEDRPMPAGGRPASATPGVDFVYPSVAPGLIDPAVAGQPGINGPAAEPQKD